MPPSKSENRIAGIDTIRFFLALWVYFGHFGFLPFREWIGAGSSIRLGLIGIADTVFNGPTAVIGFFLISGFCIHYPFRRGEPVPTLQFYARRYVRIGIPFLAALALSRGLGQNSTAFYNGILWSIVAELVYYTLYPLLSTLRWRFGWKILIAVSYLGAVALVVAHPGYLNYHQFGPTATWIVGLPPWLLGALLAEVWEKGTASPSPLNVWMFRLIAIAFGCAAGLLRFHAGIGYPITLTIAAPFLYYWLRLEIRGFAAYGAHPVFEYCGQFSYSMYLNHGLALAVLIPLFGVAASASWGLVRMPWMILFSYACFIAIERPSHRLARRIASALRPARQARAVVESI